MKVIISTFVILLICLINEKLVSQNTIEIEGVYAPTFSTLTSQDSSNNFETSLFHSFGFRIKYSLKSKLYFASGVYLKNQGASSNAKVTTAELPNGTGEYFTIYNKLRTLTIPLKVGYILVDNEKLNIGSEFGISNELRLNQELEFRDIIDELDFYDGYLMALNVAVDFGIKLNDKIKAKIRPSFNYQINNNRFDTKLLNYGVDLGISYRLK